MLQAGRSRVQVLVRSLDFFLIDLILLAALWSWRVRLKNLPLSMSRLSRENVGTSTSYNPMGLHGLLQGYIYFTFLSNHKPYRQLVQLLGVRSGIRALGSIVSDRTATVFNFLRYFFMSFLPSLISVSIASCHVDPLLGNARNMRTQQ
jgi:hypothetical protein